MADARIQQVTPSTVEVIEKNGTYQLVQKRADGLPPVVVPIENRLFRTFFDRRFFFPQKETETPDDLFRRLSTHLEIDFYQSLITDKNVKAKNIRVEKKQDESKTNVTFVEIETELSIPSSIPGQSDIQLGKVKWRLKFDPDKGLQLASIEFSNKILQEFILKDSVDAAILEGRSDYSSFIDPRYRLTTKKGLATSQNKTITYLREGKQEPKDYLEEQREEKVLKPWQCSEANPKNVSYLKDVADSRGVSFQGEKFVGSPEYLEMERLLGEIEEDKEASEDRTTTREFQIQYQALRAFAERKFRERQLFPSDPEFGSSVNFEIAFQQLFRSYYQNMGQTIASAINEVILNVLDPRGMRDVYLKKIGEVSQNIYFGADGRAYLEVIYNKIEISDPLSRRGWENDTQVIPGKVFAYYVCHDDGFYLDSILPSNTLLQAIFQKNTLSEAEWNEKLKLAAEEEARREKVYQQAKIRPPTRSLKKVIEESESTEDTSTSREIPKEPKEVKSPDSPQPMDLAPAATTQPLPVEAAEEEQLQIVPSKEKLGFFARNKDFLIGLGIGIGIAVLGMAAFVLYLYFTGGFGALAVPGFAGAAGGLIVKGIGLLGVPALTASAEAVLATALGFGAVVAAAATTLLYGAFVGLGKLFGLDNPPDKKSEKKISSFGTKDILTTPVGGKSSSQPDQSEAPRFDTSGEGVSFKTKAFQSSGSTSQRKEAEPEKKEKSKSLRKSSSDSDSD